ncbi:MAG TPA: sigma-70 family RNA polymerase sigma factor [Polyangia bacterium]|nr:sigma-70 family RNA polymerase sigma factor [Polyangia bacterium]
MRGIGQVGSESAIERGVHPILQDLVDDLPRLKTLARAFARNDSDAHDLVQATCVRVLERVDRLRRDDPQDSQALFVRIMRNLHVDNVRKRRISTPITDDQFAAPQRPEIPQWRQVSDEAVASAAGRLPVLYREVWTLSYDRRLDQREIAATLGLRPGTVATRVHRARMGIRAHLTTDREAA